jgi:hypothetical protein
MVHVTVTASVKVDGGPVVPLGTALDPQSYTFASVALDAAGGTDDELEVDLLPDGGTVMMLGMNVRDAAGKPAAVTVTPMNADPPGADLLVDGTLLVANAGVLKALVGGGPRTVKLKNAGTTAVTVDLLTGRAGS